ANRYPAPVSTLALAEPPPPPPPTKPYRFLVQNDDAPQVSLGYLLGGIGFNQLPQLVLYNEALKQVLYEQIRTKIAQTYSVQSAAQTFRGNGYVRFTSQASRLSFQLVHTLMQQ